MTSKTQTATKSAQKPAKNPAPKAAKPAQKAAKAAAQKPKTQTAPQQTPKQLAIKAASLLRGLDNAVAGAARGVETARKNQETAESIAAQVRQTVVALSDATVSVSSAQGRQAAPAKPATQKSATPSKPAQKAAKAAAQKPASKPAQSAQVKKPAQTASGKQGGQKAPQKAKEAKTGAGAQAPGIKPAVVGRPHLRDVAIGLLKASGQMSAANIWKEATGKWGAWSRQSLYTLLKDNPDTFRRVGSSSNYELATGSEKAVSSQPDETDRFVDRVSGGSNSVGTNAAVAGVS